MPPAARLGDMHVCPLVTPGVPPIPHVGGPILPPCMPTVLIGGMPAARATDMALCVGPPDMIAMGSPTVLIGNLMAARIGDPTVHGGAIVVGLPTVMIGEMGMGSPVTVSLGAALSGSPGNDFPPSAGASGAAAGAAAAWPAPPPACIAAAWAGGVAGNSEDPPGSQKPLSWYKAKVLTPDGKPAPNLPYALKLPDGTEVEGSTDGDGMVKVGGIPPGECHLRLLTVDRKLWKRK